MKWHSFFFLFLGVLSGTFISLVSLPEIKESKERRAFLGPAYLNSPNSTEVARQAGDDYLRIIQSSCRNGGEDPALTREGSIDRLRKLYDLAVIPVWTFTNRTNGLYLRQGSLNGDPSSWWNWNLILGDTVAIGSHLTRLAQETCGTGGGNWRRHQDGIGSLTSHRFSTSIRESPVGYFPNRDILGREGGRGP